jgi:Ca-activated chloride channel homolog
VRAAAHGWSFWVPLAILHQLLSLDATAGARGQKPRFQTGTSMVLVDVSVTGAEGRPIRGLEAQDFVVLEDGVSRQIAYFRASSEGGVTPAAPLSVVLLLDSSSSMEGSRLTRSRDAALAFIDECPSDTEIAIATFDDRLRILSEFTDDRQSLAAAVRRMTSGGGTAMYDALLDAVALLSKATHPRQAIVLSSDGADLDSHSTFEELENAVASSPASLYAVGQYEKESRDLYRTGEKYFKAPALEQNLNPIWVLERLAELTGGQAAFPERGTGIAPLLEEIARRLERQYVIGYQPSRIGAGPSETPRFRRIEVELRSGAAGRAVVRSRRGYVR